MKTIFIIYLMLIASTCTKQDCMPPPLSITFSSQDTAGKDISTVFADSVIISFIDTRGLTQDEHVQSSFDSSLQRTTFYSSFPVLVNGCISDFTLKPGSGKAYPIHVELNKDGANCKNPTIKLIQFNRQAVEPDLTVLPYSYFFTID